MSDRRTRLTDPAARRRPSALRSNTGDVASLPSPRAFRELAGPIRTALATLPAPDVARLEAAVRALADAHVVDGEVRFSATPLAAVATR
jgi:hypothetical protein